MLKYIDWRYFAPKTPLKSLCSCRLCSAPHRRFNITTLSSSFERTFSALVAYVFKRPFQDQSGWNAGDEERYIHLENLRLWNLRAEFIYMLVAKSWNAPVSANSRLTSSTYFIAQASPQLIQAKPPSQGRCVATYECQHDTDLLLTSLFYLVHRRCLLLRT